MKVAVFGSKGYIGSQLVYFLKSQGVEVGEYDLPESDVTNTAFWSSFDPCQYGAVLYFSGLTGTERSFANAEKFLMVNESSLLMLLQKLAPLGKSAPFVLYPSSRLVYQGSESPLDENAPKEAKTVYAANKLACEALLQAYSARYGVRYAVVRICVPYGSIVSHDYSYGTVGLFVRQAMTGRITVYGDGMLRRTFTHMADICSVMHQLVEKSIVGTYNIGGTDLRLKDAAEVVARSYGAKVDLVPWPEAVLRIESGSTFFDARRLSAEIGPFQYHEFAKTFYEI